MLLQKKMLIVQKYSQFVKSAVPDLIFWCSFILLLVIHCIENTSIIYSEAVWLNGMYLFRNLLYLVLIGEIALFSTFEKKECICAVFVGIVALGSALASRDFALMEFFIVMLAAKGKSPRRLVMVFAVIKETALMLTLLFWRIGLLSAIYYQDDKVGFYNTYGFCHRNVLAANVTVLCLAWFYLRYKSLKVWDVIVWTAIAFITFRYAASRTGMIIILLIIFGMYIVRKKRSWLLNFPSFRRIFLLGFVLMIGVSVLGTIFYSDQSALWKLIDSVFTKRFQYANYCLKEFGLSLFGQALPFVSSIEAQTSETSKLILDNSYMRALLYYGIIPGGMFLAIYFQALNLSLKKKNEKLALSLFILAFFGISERYMLDVYYQFPLWIAWNKYFFSEQKEGLVQRKTFVEYLVELFHYCKGKLQ